jgi:hypothetical protein
MALGRNETTQVPPRWRRLSQTMPELAVERMVSPKIWEVA